MNESHFNLQRAFIAAVVLPLLLAGCRSSQPATSNAQSASTSRYPAHWWAAVPKEGAPEWG